MADAKIISYGKDIGAGTTVIPDNLVAVNVESVDGKDYIEIDTTDGSEKLILAAGGANVGVGASPAHLLHVQDGDLGIVTNNADNATAKSLIFKRSKSNTDGTVAAVADDDELGSIEFFGAEDSDSYALGAKIVARVNGTPGDGDMPTELVFAVSADGSETPTERLVLSENGALINYGAIGAGDGNASTPGHNFRDQNNTGMFHVPTGSLAFSASGTERMRIANDGKVGIGTSSPTAIVQTAGSLATQGAGQIDTITGTTVEGTGGTAFLSKFGPGSAIKFTNNDGGTEIRTVASVTDDDTLVLTETPGATGASRGTKTYFHDPSLFKITTGDGVTALELNESSMQLQIPDGSLKRPGLRFGSSGDTGFFSPGAGRICATVDADDNEGGIVLILEGTEDTPNGKNNTAIGPDALKNHFNYSPAGSRGTHNCAIGGFAATQLTTGGSNLAIGRGSMWRAQTSSHENVAVGVNALYQSGVKADNTAIGHKAGTEVSTGTGNVCIGHQAADAMSTNTNGVYIGKDCAASATTGVDNEIVIGSNAVGQGADTVMLGDSQITGLHCYDTSISSPSDSRIKTSVEDSSIGLDFINALRPVKYQKKHPSEFPEEIREERWSERTGSDIADNGTETEYTIPADTKPEGWQSKTEYGLIAQEVKAVMDQHGPDWHGHTVLPNGMQSLGYGALTIVLVKSVQELSAQVTALTARIEQLEGGE